MGTKPVDLNVPDKGKAEFKTTFGLSWEDALKQNKVFNAMDGCAKLEMTGDQMESQWAITKKAKKLVKFGGGFYAGLVMDKIYVINGFYMAMREKYTLPSVKLHYYTIE